MDRGEKQHGGTVACQGRTVSEFDANVAIIWAEKIYTLDCGPRYMLAQLITLPRELTSYHAFRKNNVTSL